MIVISEERLLPTAINMLTLQKNGMYYYVHRDVYDKAVILSDKYKDINLFIRTLEVGDSINLKLINMIYEELPKPINILAPYLGLINEEMDNSLELCCGALHVITGMLNVREFPKLSRELRKTVEFSLSIKEEYELSWERFFLEAVPYDERYKQSQSRYYDNINNRNSYDEDEKVESGISVDENGNMVFIESEGDDAELMAAFGNINNNNSEEEIVEKVSASSKDEAQQIKKALFTDVD